MAKYFVSTVAMWRFAFGGGVRLAVSVESEKGRPVTGLKQGNFTVGSMGSSGSGAWLKQKVTGLESSNGSPHGFYMLFIAKYTYDSVGSVRDWDSVQDFDSVLTVEVSTPGAKRYSRGSRSSSRYQHSNNTDILRH
jgi:hypothetical protein